MPDVLLATCAALPAGDEDGDALVAALGRVGVVGLWAAWDDTAVDWSAAPTVLRSTWDYTARRADFLRWVDGLPAVFNPATMVRWSSDKTYLLDLLADGVPITPTSALPPDGTAGLPEWSGEVVVKPSVGAGSRGAGRFVDPTAAQAHVAALHAAGRVALVQPYLDRVAVDGETALVYLDGAYSHAVRKGPMLGTGPAHPVDERAGLFIEENISARRASPAERAVGDAAVASVNTRFGAPPLYARVDLLPSTDGPVVVELELVEPSLFLGHDGDDGPVRRLAAAIAARL